MCILQSTIDLVGEKKNTTNDFCLIGQTGNEPRYIDERKLLIQTINRDQNLITIQKSKQPFNDQHDVNVPSKHQLSSANHSKTSMYIYAINHCEFFFCIILYYLIKDYNGTYFGINVGTKLLWIIIV